jgi:hypothetical protein
MSPNDAVATNAWGENGPAKNPQDFNRYSYGLNNPLKNTDPTGHWAAFIGFSVNRTYFGWTGVTSVGVSFDSERNVALTLAGGAGGSTGAFGLTGGVTAGYSPDAPNIDAVGGWSTVVGGSAGEGTNIGTDLAFSKVSPTSTGHYTQAFTTVGTGIEVTPPGLPGEGHAMGVYTAYGPRMKVPTGQDIADGIKRATLGKACVDPRCSTVDIRRYFPKTGAPE